MRRFAPGFQLLTILPLLAAGAKVRTALGDDHPPDERLATGAGFARALIDAVAELEEALAPFRVDVIGNGRPARGDGLGEHGDDGVVQFACPVAPYAWRQRQRMYAGAKEGFIGVDVADAAHEGLVE